MSMSRYGRKHTMYVTLLFTSCSEEKSLPYYSAFCFAFEIEMEDMLS